MIKIQKYLYFCFLIFSAPLWAKTYPAQGPLTVRTQNPVYLQTANLDPVRALTLPDGVLEMQVNSAYSNMYEYDFNKTYNLNMDMELWRVDWLFTYGLLPGMDVGLDLPFLHMNGGFMDAFIQDYHHFFGFPNGGRNFIPNGIFNDRLSENGSPKYLVGPQDLNLGDITVFIKNLVTDEGEKMPAVAWRFGFKIPTGDQRKGMGSGNPGFGFGLAAEKSIQRVHGYLNLNYLEDGGNNALSGLMNMEYFDFSLAGEYSFSNHVGGILQLTGGTPRLKGTGMVTWDGVPMDFIVGVRGDELWGRFADPFFWQVGFSEDILSEGPSVDFTVYLSVGVRFDTKHREFYKGDMWGKL